MSGIFTSVDIVPKTLNGIVSFASGCPSELSTSRSTERPAALHTPGYDFNDEVLPIGAALLASIAERRLPAAGNR